MTGSLVSPATRARVRDLATPVATALGRLGLSPNALTLIGFAGTCLAAWAAAGQRWQLAGVLVIAFGIFDLFDGTLARATGRSSRLGAFLDSTFDRAGEAIVYLGIAAGSLAAGFESGAVLAGAAMAASFMVSYVRAKAESLGFGAGSGMAAIGLAPREVRTVLLAIGLVLAPVAFVDPLPGGPLTVALAAIAILATLTTVQRILHVATASRREDRRAAPPHMKDG